ncbi:MAG TPA: PIN domain-containing protein [Tepidisphaeraceae bacterium]
MSKLYVVDTHALVWHLLGDPNLGTAAREVLVDPQSRLVVPAICLLELFGLVEKKRIASIPCQQLLQDLPADPRITIAPLDMANLYSCLLLKGFKDLHDRSIVATALTYRDRGFDVALLTRDRFITEECGLPIVWDK